MKALGTTNIRWFADEGEARFGRRADGALVVEWPGFLRIAVTQPPEIEASDVDEEMMSKIREGVAAGLARYLDGDVVFHGSCVAISDAAYLILGSSGAGKSTLAALMSARGATLLADDTCIGTLNEQLEIAPTERGHWLDARASVRAGFQPSRETKSFVAAKARATGPVAVRAILWLEAADRVAIVRCHGMAAMAPLLNAMLRLPLGSNRALDDFETMHRIAKTVPVFHVLRDQQFSDKLIDTVIGET